MSRSVLKTQTKLIGSYYNSDYLSQCSIEVKFTLLESKMLFISGRSVLNNSNSVIYTGQIAGLLIENIKNENTLKLYDFWMDRHHKIADDDTISELKSIINLF